MGIFWLISKKTSHALAWKSEWKRWPLHRERKQLLSELQASHISVIVLKKTFLLSNG